MTTNGPAVHQDPTAVMGRRAVAYLIDIVIALAIIIVVLAMVTTAEELSSAEEAELVCDRINDSAVDLEVFCAPADNMVLLLEDSDIATVLLVPLVYFLATQVILPALTGFSPGKAMVGLRIVNKETFAKAGFGANLIRALLWIVDSLPIGFLVPLVGIVTSLASKGHRRVGDMAASTLVVDRNQVGTPIPVPGANSVPATGAPPPGPSFGGSAPPPPPPAGAASPLSPPPPADQAASPPPPDSPPVAPPIAPPPSTPALGADDTGEFGVAGGPTGSAPEPEAELTDQTSVFASPSPAPPTEVPGFAPPTAETPVADETPEPAQSASTPEPEAAPDPAPTTEPESGATPESTPPEPEPESPPEPEAPSEVRPGIDAPQWDDARDTYIQWDPDRAEWMEWSASSGTWIPISQ